MWAALPIQPWLPTATAKPPLPPRLSMVGHNLQTKEKMSRVVVAALKSNEPNAVKPKTKTEEEQKQQLSGSDILMALQRATAQKSAQKQRSTKKQKGRKNDGAATENGGSNIKALCIKPEWSDRLQELERRLHQLSHD